MELLLNILALVGGLVILSAGGEALVRGASALARRVGVSALVVGLTVVAFGTSAPEIAVSVSATVVDKDDLAIGNVVGSCIANLLLVLGLAALVRPLVVARSVIRTDTPVMLLVFAVFVLFAIDRQEVVRWQGIVFVSGLALYTVLTYFVASRQPRAIEREYEEGVAVGGSLLLNGLLLLLGFAGLVGGANLIVHGASGIAEMVGVSEKLIGLTIVAVGTSLPEIATCIVAARRNQPDIAVGNAIGSNIFNILAVIGVAASVNPLTVGREMMYFDIPVMLGTGLLILPVVRTGHRISRAEGAALLSAYVAYLAWTAYGELSGL